MCPFLRSSYNSLVVMRINKYIAQTYELSLHKTFINISLFLLPHWRLQAVVLFYEYEAICQLRDKQTKVEYTKYKQILFR